MKQINIHDQNEECLTKATRLYFTYDNIEYQLYKVEGIEDITIWYDGSNNEISCPIHDQDLNHFYQDLEYYTTNTSINK